MCAALASRRVLRSETTLIVCRQASTGRQKQLFARGFTLLLSGTANCLASALPVAREFHSCELALLSHHPSTLLIKTLSTNFLFPGTTFSTYPNGFYISLSSLPNTLPLATTPSPNTHLPKQLNTTMIHWTTVVLAADLAFWAVREYRQGRHIVSCGPGRIQYGEPPAGATKGPTTTIICYL